jgi:hypothetical protein
MTNHLMPRGRLESRGCRHKSTSSISPTNGIGGNRPHAMRPGQSTGANKDRFEKVRGELVALRNGMVEQLPVFQP